MLCYMHRADSVCCGIRLCLVSSCFLIFHMSSFQEYLACAIQYPSVATDIVKRLTELLHLFHTRTHSQVLGAGAMQTARLQSISCRHLALASQSLSLVTMALPHIRAALSKLLLPRQQLLLVDLDRVRYVGPYGYVYVSFAACKNYVRSCTAFRMLGFTDA